MYVSTEKVFDIRGCVMTILNSCFKCIGVFVQKISFIDEFANLWNFLHPHININFPFEKKITFQVGYLLIIEFQSFCFIIRNFWDLQ